MTQQGRASAEVYLERVTWFEDDDVGFLGSLAGWSALGLLLGVYVATSPAPPTATFDTLPAHLARLPTPVFVESPPAPVQVEVGSPVPKVAEKKVEPQVEVARTEKATETRRDPTKRAMQIERAKDRIEARMKKSGLIGTRHDTSWAIDPSDAVALDSLQPAPTWTPGEGGPIPASGDDLAGYEINPEHLGGGNSEIGGGPMVHVTAAPILTEDTDTDVAVFKRSLTKLTGQVRYCYESELKKDATLGGRIELGAEIVNGRVMDVWTETSTLHSPALESCLHDRVRRAAFPAHATGEIQWPYVFLQK